MSAIRQTFLHKKCYNVWIMIGNDMNTYFVRFTSNQSIHQNINNYREAEDVYFIYLLLFFVWVLNVLCVSIVWWNVLFIVHSEYFLLLLLVIDWLLYRIIKDPSFVFFPKIIMIFSLHFFMDNVWQIASWKYWQTHFLVICNINHKIIDLNPN